MTTMEPARFTIHDGAEAALPAERPATVVALRRRLPGGLAAYLTREDDGGRLDVILGRSRADAEEAARTIGSVPECAAWFRDLAGSGGPRHVEVVDAWPGEAG
ncbi:hypothetical protein OHS18_17250 [Amycolatopsis sp. NBC_00355]|uniref:hypothetical protein n=1 Tax=Amycolatopsis sp. NBC_00355 TaxID=2975957 RepID=UPI002E25ECDE